MATKILALDPGGTTGYACLVVEGKKIGWENFGNLKDVETNKLADLIDWADVVVCENFRLRPKKGRAGSFDYSEMPTSKLIGKIEAICEIRNTKLVLQEPAIKPVGYGFSNQKYVPGKPGTHWQDALAHGVYYAVSRLGCLPVGG